MHCRGPWQIHKFQLTCCSSFQTLSQSIRYRAAPPLRRSHETLPSKSPVSATYTRSGSTDSSHQVVTANATNTPLLQPCLRFLFPPALLQNGGDPIARTGGQGTPVGGVCYGQGNYCLRWYACISTSDEIYVLFISLSVPDSL